MIIFKFISEKWDEFDRWACRDFPVLKVRLWWRECWVRKDEFHPSLEVDIELIQGMDPLQLIRHRKDLVRRKIVAHRRYAETQKSHSA